MEPRPGVARQDARQFQRYPETMAQGVADPGAVPRGVARSPADTFGIGEWPSSFRVSNLVLSYRFIEDVSPFHISPLEECFPHAISAQSV